MSNRVTHFEIQADDTDRAVKFYKDIFGWEFIKWDPPSPEATGGQVFAPTDYWMIMTAPKDSKELGINGGLLKRPTALPKEMCGTNAFVCTVQVENYDEIEKKILENGGVVAMPKFALPGMAWQGYYLDTEGNTFGLHQTDPNAK